MASSNVDIAIRAKNEASGAIRQVSADLQNLDNAASGGGLGNLGNMLAGGLIAGGLTVLADKAVQAAGAIYDLGKSAASFDALRASFDDLASTAGESGDAMLNSLRGASQGMIADQDLILSANRAMMLGVAQSSEQMVQLLQVATVRGKAMGMSATDAFNDLVTGLGRMSPLILDNLGIVTGGEKVFDDYAKSLGTTASALTDAERKQALFNKVVGESQNLLSKPMQVNPFAQLDAQMANLKVQVGQLAMPMAASFADAFSSGLGGISTAIGKALEQDDLNEGETFGFALGVAVKEAVRKGANSTPPLDPAEWFPADFMKFFNDMGAGTRDALLTDTRTPDEKSSDERNATIAERSALMEELTLKTQQYGIAVSDMLGTLDQYFALNAAGNTSAADVVYEQAMAKIEAAKQLKAENEILAESYNQLGEAIGLTAKKMQGPSLDPGWSDYTHAAKAATAATTEVGTAAAGVSAGMESAASAGFDLSYALNAISGSAGAIPGALAAAASAVNSIRAEMVSATIAGMAMADAMAVVQQYSGLEKSGQQIAQGLTNLGFYEPQQIAYAVDLNTQTALAKVKDLAAEAGKVPEALKTQTKVQDYGIGDITRGVKVASGAQEAYQKAVADTNEETRSGTREAVKFGDTVAGSTSYGKQKTDELRGAFGELGSGVEDALGGAGGGGAAGAVDGLSTSLDDLRGKVQGVLSGALDTGVGVKASDFLPREDDINENARRLADIAVNGFKGQDWLGEFATEAPAAYQEIMAQVAAGVDAKTAAAKIYQDFQAGLRPDLIDKGLVKERVKAMIIGDQNMAALAEEIAQELATEMGIPLSQALAAAGASMGVTTGAAGEAALASAGGAAGATDMTGGGVQAGQTWIAGFLAQADGTQIVAGIVAKLTNEMPKFLDAGKGAGTQWGAGFMSTVESGIANPLINLLVTLVTPGIMAQMAAGKSQTEPPQ
jgi:hypothetical protein